MELNSFQELLEQQVLDLFSAEDQLVKALPELADAASNDSLREAIENHLRETEEHVRRLDRVAKLLEIDTADAEKCRGMRGLIEEAQEMTESEGDETVIDAGIIAVAQRVEHYEISAYGTARAFAERLGYTEIADLLGETLEEEELADKTLNEIAENEVNEEAAVEDEQDVLEQIGAESGQEGSSDENEEKPEQAERVPRAGSGSVREGDEDAGVDEEPRQPDHKAPRI